MLGLQAQPSRGSLASIALVGLLGSCVVDEELARKAWLHGTLVRDNQVFLERDPELAGGKLAKMGHTPYAYFRGSAAQFGRDFSEAGSPGYHPTRYLDEETWDIALVGDPHPENIGTFIGTDGVLRVEFNDFDGATWGPWISDVRRLALGFDVACRQVAMLQPADAVSPISEDDCASWVRAVVEGYVAEQPIVATEVGAGLRMREGTSHGVIVDDLLAKAREHGDERSRLSDYTVVEGDVRGMLYAELEPSIVARFGDVEVTVISDAVVEPTAEQLELVAKLLDAYSESLVDPPSAAELALKGVARRLGSGVSSYPVPRFYLLVEGPSASVDDDVLLEAKQVLDPLVLPGAPQQPKPGWPNNLARVIEMQRRMQDEGTDRWLGGAMIGDLALKVRHYSGYQRGFSVDRLQAKLAEGDWLADDVRVFADQAGRLLAVAHARGRKRDGQPSGPAIARVLGDDPGGFVEETVAFVDRYGERTTRDHELLGALIEEQGPTLGYRRQGGAW